MANSTATIQVNVSHTGPGGNAVSEPALSVLAPYQPENTGSLDIPVGATVGSSHTIPFGGVAQATGVVIKNGTSQDMVLKSAGATVGRLAPGGVFAMAGATATGTAGALTAMTVEPGTTTQAAVEKVSYWIFGDPT